MTQYTVTSPTLCAIDNGGAGKASDTDRKAKKLRRFKNLLNFSVI